MLLLFKYKTQNFSFWFEISHVIQHDLCFHLLICCLNSFKIWNFNSFPSSNWKKIPNFQCGLRLLDVSMQCTSQNPTAPCFLQHSFFYFNSLLCTWLMIFRDRRLLVGCRSHRLMKKLGVLLSELPSPQCGRVSQRLLNDWTLLHSASLMDGKQGRPLFHPDSLTRLIY